MRRAIVALILASLLMLATTMVAFAQNGTGGSNVDPSNPPTGDSSGIASTSGGNGAMGGGSGFGGSAVGSGGGGGP